MTEVRWDQAGAAWDTAGVRWDQRVVAADAGAYTGTGAPATMRRALRLTAAPGVYAVAGSPAAVRKASRVLALAGVYAVTGAPATVREARRLAANAGAYALTGVAATLRRALRLPADSGSYALPGAPATFRQARTLAANAGAYAVTGAAAGLNVTAPNELPANSGTYALAGPSAALRQTRHLGAQAGAYATIGTPAISRHGRTLAATPGAYAGVGRPAGLDVAGITVFPAGSGAYALAGVPATVRRTRRLVAAPGVYAVTGDAATLRVLVLARTLEADSGSYALLGTAAALASSGRYLLAAPGHYVMRGVPSEVPEPVAGPAPLRFPGFPTPRDESDWEAEGAGCGRRTRTWVLTGGSGRRWTGPVLEHQSAGDLAGAKVGDPYSSPVPSAPAAVPAAAPAGDACRPSFPMPRDAWGWRGASDPGGCGGGRTRTWRLHGVAARRRRVPVLEHQSAGDLATAVAVSCAESVRMMCPTCRRPWGERTERRCPRCGTVKPLTAFGGPDAYCRVCRTVYQRVYRRREPPKAGDDVKNP